MSFRNCYLCKRDLDPAYFNSKRKECKDCSKGIKLLSRYGITQAQYDRKLREQGGVCTICSRPPAEVGVFVQDHDHDCCPGDKSCGKCLRDLICMYDNTALGLMRDDVERIRKAAEYIEFHRKGFDTVDEF